MKKNININKTFRILSTFTSIRVNMKSKIELYSGLILHILSVHIISKNISSYFLNSFLCPETNIKFFPTFFHLLFESETFMLTQFQYVIEKLWIITKLQQTIMILCSLFPHSIIEVEKL